MGCCSELVRRAFGRRLLMVIADAWLNIVCRFEGKCEMIAAPAMGVPADQCNDENRSRTTMFVHSLRRHHRRGSMVEE